MARAGATGRAGTAGTAGLRRRRLVARGEPLGRPARRWPRPETHCEVQVSRLSGSARGGRGPGWAGRLRLGPGDPRLGCHLPRAPAGRPASPSHGVWLGGGWEPSRGARPFPLWRRRLGPQGRAGGMQVVPLAPRHPSSTFLPPPRPPTPLTPSGDETRQAGRGGWVRDAPLAVSAPQLPNCAKFCLLGPAKDA